MEDRKSGKREGKRGNDGGEGKRWRWTKIKVEEKSALKNVLMQCTKNNNQYVSFKQQQTKIR